MPKELEAGATPGKGTDVKLVDKQNEEYVAPAYVAFGGDGQTMGSVRGDGLGGRGVVAFDGRTDGWSVGPVVVFMLVSSVNSSLHCQSFIIAYVCRE